MTCVLYKIKWHLNCTRTTLLCFFAELWTLLMISVSVTPLPTSPQSSKEAIYEPEGKINYKINGTLSVWTTRKWKFSFQRMVNNRSFTNVFFCNYSYNFIFCYKLRLENLGWFYCPLGKKDLLMQFYCLSICTFRVDYKSVLKYHLNGLFALGIKSLLIWKMEEHAWQNYYPEIPRSVQNKLMDLKDEGSQ